MRCLFHAAGVTRLLTIMLTAVAGLALASHAQTVKTIYGLPGYNFGAGGLVSDAAGNMFGGAVEGSTNCLRGLQCGVVFELSPSGSGWNGTIIYNFTGTTDGSGPATGLVFDAQGNLYGASTSTIYRLSPASGGSWTETTLYTFTGLADGGGPTGPLAVDTAGNVYGTTLFGGSYTGSCVAIGCGVAFQLSPNADGSYTETVLHTFTGGSDGWSPLGGLVLLGQDLYGATAKGGSLSHCSGVGCGVVFELVPSSTGWKEFVLHSFSGGSDGASPFGTLTADSAGNLFGTAGHVAYELTKSSGKWQETVLYRFKKDAVGFPAGGVVLDAAGNIFGESDSAYCNSFIAACGTVYELSNSSSGWNVSAHYRFGNNPSGTVLLDPSGDIFGISNGPSQTGGSVVFEITP